MTKELLLELYLQADEVSSEDISLCLYYFSSAYKKFPKSLSHAPLHETPMDYRLLCPWTSPGKNTGVGCCFLLQRVFLIQGSNLQLLHWQVDSLPLSRLGSPLLSFRCCDKRVPSSLPHFFPSFFLLVLLPPFCSPFLSFSLHFSF